MSYDPLCFCSISSLLHSSSFLLSFLFTKKTKTSVSTDSSWIKSCKNCPNVELFYVVTLIQGKNLKFKFLKDLIFICYILTLSLAVLYNTCGRFQLFRSPVGGRWPSYQLSAWGYSTSVEHLLTLFCCTDSSVGQKLVVAVLTTTQMSAEWRPWKELPKNAQRFPNS